MNESIVSEPGEKIVVPIKTVPFAKESILFGIRNFYRVGFWWWLFIVILTGFSVLLELVFPGGQEHHYFLGGIFGLFITLVFDFPIFILGLEFSDKGMARLERVKESLPQIGQYLLGWILFYLSFLLGGCLWLFLSWAKIIGTIIAGIIVVYWVCRIFPFVYVILDKKMKAVSAFQYSLEITRNNFRPILLLMAPLVIFDFLLSGFTFQFGTLLSAPIFTLASIFAYRKLVYNYEEVGGK